jgi:hypothetical protein
MAVVGVTAVVGTMAVVTVTVMRMVSRGHCVVT